MILWTVRACVRLKGRRLRHVLDVHRATVGDELCVGIVNNRIGTGKVVRLDRTVLEMEVTLERMPPLPLPLTLVLALPRPKALRRVLRSVSSLGVKRIILLNAFRVEKSYWQSPFLEQSAMNEQLMLGLEQARDTVRSRGSPVSVVQTLCGRRASGAYRRDRGAPGASLR